MNNEFNKISNAKFVKEAYLRTPPKDNPSSENADVIDELIVRLQMAQGRIERWEDAAYLVAETPEELKRFVEASL